ncbi:MAG: Crp/Fnr family transcriptional regulator [Anaerovoracaceae bacterium]
MRIEPQYQKLLLRSPLFQGVTLSELESMLDCLGSRIRYYEKSQYVWHAGSKDTDLGIVLEGIVHVAREDYWGNRSIVAKVGPGDMFGESFSWARTQYLPVNVMALSTSKILFLDYKRMVTSCTNTCQFHTRLIGNMLNILAEKNIQLNQKMEFLSRRTIRDKVLAYLSSQAQAMEGDSFYIPFDRQELADFLAVDRSALSKELSRMAREGVLEYRKNWFHIKARPSGLE